LDFLWNPMDTGLMFLERFKWRTKY
jgi:hypothetical protein